MPEHDPGVRLLPVPSDHVVMDATGVYWRRIPNPLPPGGWLYGIVPVSDNPDPIVGPLAVLRLVGFEEADGSLSLDQRDESRDRRVAAYDHISRLVRDGGSVDDIDEHLKHLGVVLALGPRPEIGGPRG